VLVEVTSAAVQQAEVYVSLTGAQKKAYARDLVLAALEELGFEQGTGLLFSIIDSTIQSSIEMSVNLFNKRGVFSNH
jgi:homoaconitase/3-isopropylmalate dehydratase large subunit